jgi:dTDP-4-amino-4,6-dideoxygalactose transaminase
MNRVIPVLRPQLPDADRLLPYLRRIDANRIYSNFGPLALELESRLADQLKLPRTAIVSASSGLAALVGAIIGAAGRASEEKPFAVVPAYTFIATATAAELCGYRPILVDVSMDTWSLDPAALLKHPALDRVGLIVPVAPLGRAVELGPWRKFSQDTGIPVVVDGAASFDRVAAHPERFVGDVPVAISFHATKSFGIGEGGCVVSTDPDLISRAGAALNFGFSGTRDSTLASTNGKLSEYHAAVGLAELDGWPDKLIAMRSVVTAYVSAMEAVGLQDRLYCSPVTGVSYALFLARDEQESAAACRALQSHRVDYRFWYGPGLHGHSYYRHRGWQDLSVTDSLASRLIGLPFAPDLTATDIERITLALSEVR